MDVLQARLSVSITELKKNPSAVIDMAHGQAIAILNHNRPTAYLVPAATFEAMTQASQQSPMLLADLLNNLPPVTSIQGDPVALQQAMRNEW
jgi:prevent-host-death family protein